MFDHDVRQLCEDLVNHRKISLRLLGSGNFANVYAHPVRNDVAIKVVQNNIEEDGYRDYVDYVLGHRGCNLFPQILHKEEHENKRGEPFEVYVLERLVRGIDLTPTQRESCDKLTQAVRHVDSGWYDQHEMPAEVMEARWKKLQRHDCAYHAFRKLPLEQLLQVKEVHTMLCCLNIQVDNDWGISPDLASANVMFRILSETTAEPVVTDPVACCNWNPVPTPDDEYYKI